MSSRDLERIVARLRLECPWDRRQTTRTIPHLFIEEAYELAEALEEGDPDRIEEELGDLLYVVLMGIRIATDEGMTDCEKVKERAAKKLIRRHPHVYGDQKVKDEGEVLANWEKIKEKEKGDKGFFEGIPKSLPALSRAQMMQERAARVGFDWEDEAGPLEKVREETRELSELIGEESEEVDHELGDLLFSVVNLARHIDVRAEQALARSTRKFARRFEQVRRLAAERGLDIAKLDIKGLDELWDEVKRSHRG
ncbi:nucleoside triphosphate pyrophosphohydrolase [candidate division WOR-3 bacterium]|uniref:Nucleoside triphosphate pyrophosphohydrolase n=1 Tax=candidate division WOR-3 bacterium TaxID=2052148 RepID=A0A9D5KA90_UNCW3|nr:nucleoside triphosphate pyrophosphohydrolase [candidate division WOR-3 bacterium]MBD3364955.1 nucleoside triphosphate pyrophosphohydrolase [candidate division WOR-3 bacterium]